MAKSGGGNIKFLLFLFSQWNRIIKQDDSGGFGIEI